MDDQKLLKYYLNMREPEAYQWNMSPKSLYLELETRDFLLRQFEAAPGMKACNIGIGVGEWDDYLGYFLQGNGQLTSIDIDPGICESFTYRQKREGHPNPSAVRCDDFLTCPLPSMEYDLVTMIGSALNEIGAYRKTFTAISAMLKPGGHLMYMDLVKYHRKEELLDILGELKWRLEAIEAYERYPSIRFYCMKLVRLE
ncbi:class I SAM-dependent methyltransferase [Paenibacillus oceani]|uniref:Class I SAM-dependent methyltransferase n=1 Tax=Paenibacillus oceani TaxID=2772510 RepID=A0A927H300_9BACL|nr:class I SAM-dependent methyltransferase [Paenibacillus oceani]MBD2866776.1 class I SAM-dependent methyltransferase [Paenibacillus oceani]